MRINENTATQSLTEMNIWARLHTFAPEAWSSASSLLLETLMTPSTVPPDGLFELLHDLHAHLTDAGRGTRKRNVVALRACTGACIAAKERHPLA